MRQMPPLKVSFGGIDLSFIADDATFEQKLLGVGHAQLTIRGWCPHENARAQVCLSFFGDRAAENAAQFQKILHDSSAP